MDSLHLPDTMVWLYVVVSSVPYTCIPCMNRRKKGEIISLYRGVKKKWREGRLQGVCYPYYDTRERLEEGKEKQLPKNG